MSRSSGGQIKAEWRPDPNYLVTASVGVSEAQKEERAHVCNGSIAYALGNETPPYFPECFLACGIERKVVEPTALEHGLVARRFNSRDLKWVQDSVRTHLDEGVAQPLSSRSTVTRAPKIRS